MAKTKSVLGKNLGGLLSDSFDFNIDEIKNASLKSLPLTQIKKGQFQPRHDMDPQALSELADSIKSQGIIQPIIVRPIGNNNYEIIAGERRFRAAKLAGLTEVPAVVKEINNETALVCALVENIQRRDLNTIEESLAFQRLAQDFSLTHQEIAHLVGKSRAGISNSVRLLNLCQEVQNYIIAGELEAGHAKILVNLTKKEQMQLAKIVIDQKLSVRQLEQRIRENKENKTPNTSKITNNLPEKFAAFEKEFSNYFKLKTNFKHKSNGKGKLILHYNSAQQIEKVLKILSEAFN